MKNHLALTSIRSTMLFLLVLMAILIGLSSVFEPATARLRAAAPVGTINSNYALLSEVFVSIAVFISLLIMRRIDKTPLAERNFGKRPRYGEVALGLSAGLSTLAFVLLIQLALGVLKISPSAEAAPLQIHNCVIWAQCFLITGLCEEAVFRGYLLGTLQKGLGFWPATAISSVLFAVVHLPNYGERASGIFACLLFSVFFALTVRLTGTIWFAVGFHAAWDWSQTYLFGTSDSGIHGNGHLLNSIPSGPDWLNGGVTGPEGSVITMLVVAILIAVVQSRCNRTTAMPLTEYSLGEARQS
jgi:membrane protease YdiL (CAAX protease family)